MADYRLSAKIIGRSSGRSSVAAAAYRAGAQLHDERTGLDHDYTRKNGVLHTEIMAPDNAPDWMKDRAKLWNAVEAVERRRDAQLAREIQLSLPHELTEAQNHNLVLDFIQSHFVDHGMIADVAIHAPDRQGDQRNIHAHVMLTTRILTSDGFGNKNREWNRTDTLETWREAWADHQNDLFQKLGMEQRVDHRSYEDQGVDREPTQHLGTVANDMERKGKDSRVGNENRERQKRNADRAAMAQDAAKTTRDIAGERLRQDEHVAIQTAALSSHLLHAEIDSDRKHDRARAQLDQEIEQRNSERRAALLAQEKEVEARLAATGWKRLMRNLVGHTERDKEELTATQLNLEAMRQRENEERSALLAEQAHEKAQAEAARQEREQSYGAKLAAARTSTIDYFRSRAQDIQTRFQERQKRTVANDHARIEPKTWERPKLPEQNNTRPERAVFQAAAQSGAVRSEGRAKEQIHPVPERQEQAVVKNKAPALQQARVEPKPREQSITPPSSENFRTAAQGVSERSENSAKQKARAEALQRVQAAFGKGMDRDDGGRDHE